MPTVQSLGVGSGIDIDNIITALVDAEKVPQEKKLDSEKETIDAQISAFGTLKSKLSDIQTKANALKLTNNFDKFTATSSSQTTFTATANSLASNGSYDIKVTQTAQNHTLATTAFTSIDDAIGTGSITVKFGTTDYNSGTDTYNSFNQNSSLAEKTITITSSNNTLSSLKDFINAGSYGFSASIVNDGSGFRLLFNANSGIKNSMQITVTDDDSNHIDTNGLSRLAFNASATNLEQTQAGQDAALTINGLSVTSESNSVSEAISGVTLSLVNADAANTHKLTVARDTSAIKDQVTGLVDAYNEFNTYVNEITAYDASGVNTGVLIGDATVRNMMSQVRSILFSPVTGLSGSVQAIADLGILSDQKTGKLTVDETELSSAISSSIEDVRALFAPTGKPSDALVQYVSNTVDTNVGTYAVNITQLATKGVFNGAGVLPNFGGGGSVVIDADNDTFKIRVDGSESGVITLAQATYTTGASLAQEIQTKINADSNLSTKNLSVTVNYDSTNNRFDVTSKNFGSNSSISFTSVDTNTAAEIGFSVASGTTGTDVAGTINGKTATGSGQFLSSAEGNSKGLKLSIIGGATGSRGTVTFSRGVADQTSTLIESYVKSKGSIEQKTDGLDNTLDDIQDAKDALTLSMNKLETRLIAQFTAMDTLVSQLNNTSSFLTSALAGLPGASSSA